MLDSTSFIEKIHCFTHDFTFPGRFSKLFGRPRDTVVKSICTTVLGYQVIQDTMLGYQVIQETPG